MNYITHYHTRSWGQTFLNIVMVLLLIGAAGYVGFVEGYRRGSKDTLSVVEEKVDRVVNRLLGG